MESRSRTATYRPSWRDFLPAPAGNVPRNSHTGAYRPPWRFSFSPAAQVRSPPRHRSTSPRTPRRLDSSAATVVCRRQREEALRGGDPRSRRGERLPAGRSARDGAVLRACRRRGYRRPERASARTARSRWTTRCSIRWTRNHSGGLSSTARLTACYFRIFHSKVMQYRKVDLGIIATLVVAVAGAAVYIGNLNGRVTSLESGAGIEEATNEAIESIRREAGDVSLITRIEALEAAQTETGVGAIVPNILESESFTSWVDDRIERAISSAISSAGGYDSVGWQVGTHTRWQQGQESKRLIAIDEGVCFLALVTGKFAGAGEVVRVYQDEKYWRLGGVSHQAGVAAEAYCVRFES